MTLHVVKYWDVDKDGDFVEMREFFLLLFDAVGRRECLIEEKDGPTADFYMDKVLYTIEYFSAEELVNQLNLLNTEEGRQKLIK